VRASEAIDSHYPERQALSRVGAPRRSLTARQ
jgi:hypothetical protein